MSVDTYLKRKNLTAYRTTAYEDINILVSNKLLAWAAALNISSRRFLFWDGLKVEVAPLRPHVHGVT